MPVEAIYLLRMLLACILGFLIGLERKARSKEAGIRTHAIVSLGACLMMLISKYGFSDMGDYDGARIAAQIVSGIGFLGAGMILYRRQALSGLTTAAGIWTTAGVGMASGCGLYILSLGATILIILTQCIFHLPIKLFKSKINRIIKITFSNNNQEINDIKKLFGIKKFNKMNSKQLENGDILCVAFISTNKLYSDEYFIDSLKKYEYINAIEWADDE